MSKPRFSAEQRALIRQRYEAGESSESIVANIAGTILDDGGPRLNGVTLRNTLRQMGVTLRPAAHLLNPPVSEATKQVAVELCMKGKHREEVAQLLGIGTSTLQRALKNAHVVLPGGKPRTCEINENAFDNLTPSALYWAGFVWADGCLHQDIIKRERKGRATAGSPTLSLGLSATDRSHLEKLRAFLGSTHAISSFPPRDSKPILKGGPAIKTGPTVYYSVRSKRIVERLSELGVATKRPNGPSLEVCDSRDFWRGAIDGDGHVSNDQQYPAISLAGCLPLIERFCRYLAQHGLSPLNPYLGSAAETEDGVDVWIAGTTGLPARAIVKHLYEDSVDFLDRKRVIADEIVHGRATIAVPAVSASETAFQSLRGSPVPYSPKLPLEKVLREVARLRDLPVDVDELNVIRPSHLAGINVCKPYFPNRHAAKRKGSISAVEAWGDEKELRKAIDFQIRHGDPLEPRRVLRAINLRCRTPSIFRPAVARYICERYCPRDGVVWDPCSGYGGRLLGAHAAGVRYVGTDVDAATVQGNRELATDIGARAEVHLAPAETFDPPTVNLVFTSPPYFDREAYSDDENQSWKKYGDLDSWVSGFLHPMIARAHAALVDGGHLALNIANLKERGKVIPLVARTVSTALACGFAHVDTLQMPLAAIGKKEPAEPILIFQKQRSAAPQ